MKKVLLTATLCALAVLSLVIFPVSAPADGTGIFKPGVKITPSTLNMKSHGKFVTAHVNLPDNIDLSDPQDVRLLYTVDDNTTVEITALKTKLDPYGNLVAKFSRSELQDILSEYIDEFPEVVELEVAIAVGDNDTLLYSDDIRVIKPGKAKKN